MAVEILLPADTEIVIAEEIPRLIALALNPDPFRQEPTVSYLVKTARPGATGETAKWNGWPIDDDDRKILAEIWAKLSLPPLPDHANAAEVKPYLDAANAAGTGLDWTLDVCWNNPATNAAILRANAEEEHLKEIQAAVIRKELTVLTRHTQLPIKKYFPNSEVRVDDFTQYAARFQISVRCCHAVLVARAARALAEMEAGKYAYDDGIVWAYEPKWQAVLDHLLKARELPMVRRIGSAYQPTNEPQDAWIVEEQLQRIFDNPPAAVIDLFKAKQAEEAAKRERQRAERLAAGCYTLEEAAEELAAKSQVTKERWIEQIMAEIKRGELPLRNPRNCHDTLPYAVPKELRDFHDQIHCDTMNAWIEARPHLKLSCRLGNVASATAPAATISSEQTPAQRRAGLDMTSQRGCRRRILEAWEAIEKQYGAGADARQVLRVLNQDKQEKEPQLKTVQNHLAKLRSEKLIP